MTWEPSSALSRGNVEPEGRPRFGGWEHFMIEKANLLESTEVRSGSRPRHRIHQQPVPSEGRQQNLVGAETQGTH